MFDVLSFFYNKKLFWSFLFSFAKVMISACDKNIGSNCVNKINSLPPPPPPPLLPPRRRLLYIDGFLLRVHRSRRKYIALPLCAWNWPGTSDFGVGFVGIPFPYAGYLCVAGPQKSSSLVRVGTFKVRV